MRALPATSLRRSRSGFSLIEMAIVVAIFGILAALSATMVSSWIPTWRTRQAAHRFAADLNYARMSAVKDSVEYRVVITAWDTNLGDAAAGSVGAWLVQRGNLAQFSTVWDTLPYDGDGLVSDAEGTVVISQGGTHAIPWVSLQQPTVTTVTFSPRGWLQNGAADFGSDGYLHFDFLNKRRYVEDGGEEVWEILIGRGGVARLQPSQNLWVPTTTVGADESSTPGAATGYAGGTTTH